MSEELEATGIEPAPAAEETESAPVETEVEETPADDAGADPDKPKEAKGVQKRIDELVRQREEERRRAERYEAMLHEMYTKQQQPTQPQPAPTAEAPPKEEEFQDYGEFLRAAARYEARQELKAEQTRAQESQRQQQAREQQAQHQTRMAQMVGTGKTAFADFEAVAFNPEVRITEPVLAAAVESEAGHAIIYHLAKNPAEAARIAALSPLAQIREVGKLEAKLTAPVVKAPSTAPAPIKPVGASEPTNNEPDASKNPDAWLAWERERVRKLGRRF